MTAPIISNDVLNKQVLLLSTKLSVENQIKEIQSLLKRIQKNKEKILRKMESKSFDAIRN